MMVGAVDGNGEWGEELDDVNVVRPDTQSHGRKVGNTVRESPPSGTAGNTGRGGKGAPSAGRQEGKSEVLEVACNG